MGTLTTGVKDSVVCHMRPLYLASELEAAVGLEQPMIVHDDALIPQTSGSMRSVTICVCTFRRPQLAMTLASLSFLLIPKGVTVDVVIADNDFEPTAEGIVRSSALSCPFPVTYIHAPARNISSARNACLDEATGRYLAFIDDDEVVTPHWLEALLQRVVAPGVAVVLGPVRAHYFSSAPRWMRDGDFHSTRPVFVNGEILTGYTCNVLIDRSSSATLGLRFDLVYGRSGGEDTDFFSRLYKQGGKIVFAPEAVVVEDVPPERAKAGWLIKRRFRMGQTHGQSLLIGKYSGRCLWEMGLAAGKLLACCLLAARYAFDPVQCYRSLLRGVLHAGTFAGLSGVRALTQYGLVTNRDLRGRDAA